MKQWFSHHRQALNMVLARMWHTRLATCMMLCVVGVTLSLPAGLYLLLDNAARLAGDVDSEPQISLFLASGAKPDVIKEIDQRLKDHAGVRDHRFVDRDQAWQDLQDSAGLEDISGGLEKNPLPDAYIVHAGSSDPAQVEQLQQELGKWPGVEHAQLNSAWVKRLYSVMRIGRNAVMILAGLLGFALLAVVGNSIRLQILTQREEIEVSQLIGATDAFIRRPFLYAGALYGLGGGIAAWLIVGGATALLNASIDELARLYATDFRLVMLDIKSGLALLFAAALLGWSGSYLAVSQYLRSLKAR